MIFNNNNKNSFKHTVGAPLPQSCRKSNLVTIFFCVKNNLEEILKLPKVYIAGKSELQMTIYACGLKKVFDVP